jgi:CheY-like chemotaxis protein
MKAYHVEDDEVMKIYHVEDDEDLCDIMARYFREKGCEITSATSYEQAEKDLQGANISNYNVLLMDLKIEAREGHSPKPGEVFLEELADRLEELADRNEKLPRIIIYSGYLTEETSEWHQYLGAEWAAEKASYKPDELYHLMKAKNNMHQKYSAKTLSKIVAKREKSLKDYAFIRKQKTFAVSRFDEPLFVVARRWNSWYPSIFNVPGGAYAIVSPSADGADTTPSIVIDPGFRFMEIFNELGINIQNVNSCIITHNHPDHMGGIFEFLAARTTYKTPTKLFFNPSTCNMLRCFAGPLAEVNELNDNDMSILSKYVSGDSTYQITCKSFNTDHEEIGPCNTSKGLIITTTKESGGDRVSPKIVILGDTEYEHDRQIIEKVCTNCVNLTVLHIGCTQLKDALGKHLYLQGTLDILSDMESELYKSNYQGKMTVLISEWGLEHATHNQLRGIFDSRLPGFNDVSPIEEMMRIIKERNFNKLVVLPADIGLTFGMLSGNIYLGNKKYRPCEIAFRISDKGLEYFKKEK